MPSKIKLLIEDIHDWYMYKFGWKRYMRQMDRQGRCYKCGRKHCECHLYDF